MNHTVSMGSTGLIADKNGFGALPIQRVDDATAVDILHRAFEAGVNYFDTARGYTDSEHKLGLAFSDRREKVIIASKSHASSGEELKRHIDESLRELRCDYIDIHQFHNPAVLPKPGDGSGLYEAMDDAKRQGLVRHIGLSNHRLDVATQAAESGLYEVVQYPLSYLSDEKDLALVKTCADHNVGFAAMKALAGGLISNAKGAYAFLAQYPNVLPLWGIQSMRELEEFLGCAQNPPALDDPIIQADLEKDRAELAGEFCRACGYCAPCPAGIAINWAARMEWFVKRAAKSMVFSQEYQDIMAKVPDCIECGQCMTRCPYNLPIPDLIKRHNTYYQAALKEYLA